MDSTFSKAATVVSVILTLFGLIGVVFTPLNLGFFILIFVVIIVLILLYEKINQLDSNTSAIKDLRQRLNTAERLSVIERELSEQKGKLAMVTKK